MNRGMISLTKPQLTLVSHAITSIEHVPTELPDRLTHALAATIEPVEVLLSEDSAEAVLDALPMPQPSEDTTITETRNAFRVFLNTLRTNNPSSNHAT